MPIRLQGGELQQAGKPRVDPSLRQDAVLWRYMDAAKFFDFIYRSSLYCTRGDQLEDKFEGTFTKDIKAAIIDAYRSKGIDCTYTEFKKRLRAKVFLSCWHGSGDDSMAMWNIYGRSDSAIAITTTVGQLETAIQRMNFPYFIYLKNVEYIKHWRNPSLKVNPYSNVFSYKVKAYEFEKEVRVIFDRFEDPNEDRVVNFDGKLKEKGMVVNVEHNEFLRSIVVGPKAPIWFLSLIRAYTSERGLGVPVKRSKLWFKPT